MNSNDIKKIANKSWGKYKVLGNSTPVTSPLTYHFGTQMQSLLEKNNTQYTPTTDTSTGMYFGKNDYIYTGYSREHNFSVINTHKYLIVSKCILDTNRTSNGDMRLYDNVNYRVVSNGVSPILLGNSYFGCIVTCSESSLNTNTNWYRSSAYQGTNWNQNDTIFNAIILDLTELGLDTLTAQQFYNQYNHLFEKLANGEIVNKPSIYNPLKAVDLGTLNWAYITIGKSIFYVNLPDRKSGADIQAQCSKYQIGSWQNDKTLSFENVIGPTFIQIQDTDYTDAQTFKQAMSGVILYYELSTPITLNQNDYYINTNGKLYKSGTTEMINSAMIRSGVTKITDANGVEVEFE